MPDRRSFLSGFAKLPLISGSVALLGHPTGVATTATYADLLSYRQWLDMEGRRLGCELPEMGGDAHRYIPWKTAAGPFHFPVPSLDWRKVPPPSTRAAQVLSAVGVPIAGDA